MTDREAQIFRWITENPMISQEELAAKAGIKRSSVAVHISNLMKKGYILGKGYVTSGPAYCTIIGGANIDIGGIPDEEPVEGDSNPGRTLLSLGGVGRNIAHTMSLLGLEVKLITALGDDLYAHRITESCEKLGIDIREAYRAANAATSVYLYMLDQAGDMRMAISDMRIYEGITPEFIAGKMEMINRGKLLIIDTNIPEETIRYIGENCTAALLAETVSGRKAKKLLPILDKLHTITPNKLETQVLTGISITDEKTLRQAAQALLEKGVKNVYITLGAHGVFCANAHTASFLPRLESRVVNTSGAGDSFMAGIAYGCTRHFALRECALMGLAAASITVESKDTVHPRITVQELLKRAGMEERNPVEG